MKSSTVQSTATSQKTLRAERFRVVRKTRVATAKHAAAYSVAHLYSSAAYLRGAARRAIRRERLLTTPFGRRPRGLRRTVSRLDTRLQRISFRRDTRYGALALSTTDEQLPLMRKILRAGRQKLKTISRLKRQKRRNYTA